MWVSVCVCENLHQLLPEQTFPTVRRMLLAVVVVVSTGVATFKWQTLVGLPGTALVFGTRLLPLWQKCCLHLEPTRTAHVACVRSTQVCMCLQVAVCTQFLIYMFITCVSFVRFHFCLLLLTSQDKSARVGHQPAATRLALFSHDTYLAQKSPALTDSAIVFRFRVRFRLAAFNFISTFTCAAGLVFKSLARFLKFMKTWCCCLAFGVGFVSRFVVVGIYPGAPTYLWQRMSAKTKLFACFVMHLLSEIVKVFK